MSLYLMSLYRGLLRGDDPAIGRLMSRPTQPSEHAVRKFPEDPKTLPPASLLRRLGAMLYDSLLIIAIWMLIGGIAVALNDGKAVQGPFFSSTLFLVTYLFFAGFWTRSGQTLGMQAWRIRIQTEDGCSIGLMQSLIRFFMAMASMLCAGLGYWWMLIDKDKLTWHDRYSETRTVQLPARKKAGNNKGK